MTLQELRETLQADGADLVLESTAAGVARFRLVIQDASCADCILPRSHLEAVLMKAIRESHPDVTTVRLDDPRESG